MSAPHPARFSKAVLQVAATLVVDSLTLEQVKAEAEYRAGRREFPDGSLHFLDPFAGEGHAVRLRQEVSYFRHRVPMHFTLIELEPEWSAVARQGIGPTDRVWCGDSRQLLTPDSVGPVDWIFTSPAYGNRMADQYLGSPADHADPDAKSKGRRRNTYAYALSRKLSPGSGAALQFGEEYKTLHRTVWERAVPLLRPGGYCLLNCSDHIRKGAVVHVTDWHVGVLARECGLELVRHEKVRTPRQRRGANGALRVDGEDLVLLRKPATKLQRGGGKDLHAHRRADH